MRSNLSPKGRGQLLGAFLLIAAGVAILLLENGIITGSDIRRLWPMLLIIIGAAKLRQGGGARFGGVVLITAGVLFELAAFHLINHPERYWPLVLVAAGVILLWNALNPASQDQQPDRPRWFQLQYSRTTEGGDPVAIFGGIERRITDQNFTGMELTAIFGGYNLDLRKAQMMGDKVYITATVVCGGIELQVPESWDVELAGSPIFGGFSDETSHPDTRTNPPRLVIQGSVVFGGVNVKN